MTTPAGAQPDRALAGHRPGRARRVPRGLHRARRPGRHPDRQRDGLHHPAGGRQRRPQRLRARAAPSWRAAEEGKPNHPPGKVEWLWQTLKKWLAARDPQPADLASSRPSSTPSPATTTPPAPLPAPPGHPAAAYAARPKAGPRPRRRHPRPRPHRHRRIHRHPHPARRRQAVSHRRRPDPRPDPRHHAHQDLDIRIIDAATGELLRQLTLNPDRNYQPTGRPLDLPPVARTPRLRDRCGVSTVRQPRPGQFWRPSCRTSAEPV